MEPTQDPHVVIEARGYAMIRYRNRLTGRRWEVHGTCDNRGDCVIGSWVHGELVRDHTHLADLRVRYGPRLGFDLDCPVTPEFSGCCEFRFVELAL